MSLIGRIEAAAYNDVIFPEFQGNPLIEALPPKLSQSSILTKLQVYPPLPTDFRYSGDEGDREDFLAYILMLRQPLEIYFDVFRAVERVIKQGYSSRNPLSPTTQNYLHYRVDEPISVFPSTGKFISRGRGITLLGESGIGKTTMLEQILLYFPQVIQHNKYNNEYIGFSNQVVWIKVECPDKSSVRELCQEILISLDQVTGSPLTKPASNHSNLMFQIEQRIKSSHLGILVIDEMQNISVQRTRGESGLLKFLKKIVNRLGVPMLFCGNPDFDDVLVSTTQNARRSENGGAFYMERLSQDSIGWKAFISQLWQLQWTNVNTPLTDSLDCKLYELTVGNVDFACRTYAEAQSLVMGTGDESLCEVVLQEAYDRACVQSSRSSEVLNAKEELLSKGEQKKDSSKVNKATNNQPFIPSVDRPQHHEFSDALRDMLTSKHLKENIKDPDRVQYAGKTDSPVDYLREKRLLSEDPIAEEFF